MTYLNPPPTPAPVIVMKDVGGLVRDYQAQTELYRQTDREVRVHECHSACTLALSLPNVCVYPDSIFKFHQAYNLRNHQTDFGVSDQLFESYPGLVRARLGTLTRKFKVLSGAELIALGVRDCNTPRIMLARTRPSPSGGSGSISSTLASVMSVFGSKPQGESETARAPRLLATRQQTDAERHLPPEALLASAPLPPPRPAVEGSQQARAETGQSGMDAARPSAEQMAGTGVVGSPSASSTAPLPPQRPTSLATAFTQTLPPRILAQVIEGAQPILPPQFLAYAMIARLNR